MVGTACRREANIFHGLASMCCCRRHRRSTATVFVVVPGRPDRTARTLSGQLRGPQPIPRSKTFAVSLFIRIRECRRPGVRSTITSKLNVSQTASPTYRQQTGTAIQQRGELPQSRILTETAAYINDEAETTLNQPSSPSTNSSTRQSRPSTVRNRATVRLRHVNIARHVLVQHCCTGILFGCLIPITFHRAACTFYHRQE